MRKNFYILLFIIGIIASAVTPLNAQPWIGDTWAYRRLVTITNPGATVLTDYQVKIALDNTFEFANANGDGSDIRITLDDGITELSLWIETWNPAGQQATIWVKAPSIPIAGMNVYLYYGNNAATSTSNGTNTFQFFDDFSTGNSTPSNWIRRLEYSSGNWGPGYVAHDWKYSMEMQQGALYYAINRELNGWNIESLDAEIEQEFDYIHSQINPNGTVIGMATEPQYCYGTLLSSLALGYLHFGTSNPTLAQRCYDDMILVYGYVRATYQNTIGLNDAGGSSMALHGFSNTWKAFTNYGNTVSANEVLTIIQNYTTTFINNRTSGSWNGASGVQEHLKRNFGVLKAYDVTGNFSYLTAVRDNIDYILATYWVSSNGGLEWRETPSGSDHFYECHQQWFMIAVKLLYDESGGTYDYLTQAEQAWLFLTDNNYANVDMYVHNYVNHNAFFSYRQILQGGTIQYDAWKGSYEIGTALWGMSLNYDWVSNYQSSHSTQSYNYLDEMVKQIKSTPSNRGYYNPGTFIINISLWSIVGSPTVSIYQDGGNPVASFLGYGGTNGHNYYIASTYNNFDNEILEMKFKMTVDINNNCTPEIGFRVTDNNNRYITMLRGEGVVGGGGPNGDLFIRRYQGGVQTNTTYPAFNYTANNYYKYKIVANGATIEQYLDDNLIRNWNDAGTGILSGRISLTNYGGTTTNPVYYDDVRVRSYTAIEPTTLVGSEEANPLPVELSSFTASTIGSTVKLIWRTVTEVNNYGFEVERQIHNGQLSVGYYEKIGFVNGNGNSNSPKNYSFTDSNPIGGSKFQYRLKQIDNDGQYEYSKTIEVNFDAPKKFELSQNYPNPFNPVTTIRFSLPEGGNVKLTLYNPLGQEIKTMVNEYKESGTHIINFDASDLNSGMYIFKLESDSFIQTKKMILLK